MEGSGHVVQEEHRVTPLELFFDLVFVFGFTQVTTLLHDDPTWGGLARGLLALAVLWWPWAAYAWLTNALDPNEGSVIATVLAATAAMFVAALAVPDAFGRHRLVFAVAFLVVLATHAVLFTHSAKGERDLLETILRGQPWTALGGAVILGAAFAPSVARPLLWLAAFAVGIVGPARGNMRGLRVRPAHFAERHGLIVIIAIGEALAAIGFAARDTALGLGVVAAVLLGLTVAASFWLAYFDFASGGLQELLERRHGVERATLARDAYSYLHLPMIVGIVLFAYAMRTAITHVDQRLATIPALALVLGSAVYLLAYVGLRWRVNRTLGRGRPIATVVFVLAFPVALVVPALASLALVAAIWVALHAYELIAWREQRAARRRPTANAVN